MNTNDYWKNKAEESQNRIYINININNDTTTLEEKIQELKEEIQELQGNKQAQVTFNYSTDQELKAKEIIQKITNYLNRDF